MSEKFPCEEISLRLASVKRGHTRCLSTPSIYKNVVALSRIYEAEQYFLHHCDIRFDFPSPGLFSVYLMNKPADISISRATQGLATRD